jgi:hypothetical protein
VAGPMDGLTVPTRSRAPAEAGALLVTLCGG